MQRIVSISILLAFSVCFFTVTGGTAPTPEESSFTAVNVSARHNIDDVEQQQVTVSGRVVDQDGFPMPGVQVAIKERRGVGVVTDIDGKYTLKCGSEETLVYSFIGYITKEEKAIEANNVTITLQEDVVSLEEVQVVAFGKQKKESVVSSITTISPKELKVPSSNMTTAFAGRLAGVIAYQRSGEPGLDNAEFFIRGITSFSSSGKRNPLILIDGVEMNATDLAKLNPDDIASFSVMKDANSAALYGARGANGVILVTSKEGTPEQMSINVRGELSSSANSNLVELADPVTYMKLHNEARITRQGKLDYVYSPEKIYNTERGIDPLRYPSVNWYDYLVKDRTFNQRVNVNISGGGKMVQYYIAGNMQHDTGILKEVPENTVSSNIDIKRFQLRSNVTIKLTPRTKGMVRFYGTFDDSHGPQQSGEEVFNLARNATSVRFLPTYPKDEANLHTNHLLFGTALHTPPNGYFINPLAQIVSGYKESKKSMMLTQMEVDHNFDNALKGLFMKGLMNLKRESYYDLRRSYKPFYYEPVTTLDGSYRLRNFNPTEGSEYLSYEFGQKSVIASLYGEFRAGYNRVFAEKHDMNILLVSSFQEITNTEATSIQQSLPQRNISTAGRFAYGYDSRYFAEFNFGYNGSERFAKNYRFGFFPSVGAGWVISNESFMEPYRKTISNLKLKATYGLVGNDEIGSLSDRFFYMSQVNMSDSGYGYTFGTDLGTTKPGISISRYANPLVTWEVSKKMNLGFELGLFNDLSILFDYFTERRENILQTRQNVPSSMGLATIPQSNLGVAKGKGFETEIKYQKSFNKDLWLVMNGNFTYAVSRYVKVEEPNYSDVPWRSKVGRKLGQLEGLIAERLFIDEEEVRNSPIQNFGDARGTMAGDIKYMDINNDGIIDSNDIVPIGYSVTPEIIYGAGFSTGYRNFDLSAFFQGSARSSFMIDVSNITPFINTGQRALLKYIADDHWSENNRSLHPFWPRLSEEVISNNTRNSTYWLQDGSFLRLKTAELGYTLPQSITKKFRVNTFRLYLSGSNLLVWSKFKLWDVEMAGNGLGYPVQRVYNLGVNIIF
ncbi:TonB-dependent receptor [Proteiniphilum sp.]|uniref:SusC/RagA family TonB-linked outer membrane protein n=1 Tax=Proteiniphilum sp. TaxID=1926877 RepID=UPI002B1F81AB|nr:TonB-dependent receptor [Proteiniphilum sp.]MEA4917177.1 TonB-dependent receptor [Proteiniphilum sp.]